MKRLLHVLVQPVYVEVGDDGEFGEKFTAPVIEVTARDWPGYPAKLAEADLRVEDE